MILPGDMERTCSTYQNTVLICKIYKILKVYLDSFKQSTSINLN